jgi:hypothetical protein
MVSFFKERLSADIKQTLVMNDHFLMMNFNTAVYPQSR